MDGHKTFVFDFVSSAQVIAIFVDETKQQVVREGVVRVLKPEHRLAEQDK